MLAELKNSVRYARGLRTYLREPMTLDKGRELVRWQQCERAAGFLQLVELGIFARATSPYRKLLEHAGISFSDVREAVRRDGVEVTLQQLYEAGVYVSLEEFKGRRPVQRPGLTIRVSAADFDNPLPTGHYQAKTGGSRGSPRRVLIDLGLLNHESAYLAMFRHAVGQDRPIGIWYSVPPGIGGIKLMLWHARLGQSIDRWFSQSPVSLRHQGLKQHLLTRYTLLASRRSSVPWPTPHRTPLDAANRVARWLGEVKQNSVAAELHTNPSSAMRICAAANSEGIDISDSLFQLYSEPFPPSRAKVIETTGCHAMCHWNMAEVGRIAIACTEATNPDEAHILDDKVAIIQPETTPQNNGARSGEFILTTLLPSCPKLMLNVRSGDYGVLEPRNCGCVVQAMGFKRQIHTIRSREKFTSEGVHVLADDLWSLTDVVLPVSFGGNPTDFQFEEEHNGALPRINLLVSPRVGQVDEQRMIEIVLSHLASARGPLTMMAEHWRNAGTLRVVRREPHQTPSFKIPPLHISTSAE